MRFNIPIYRSARTQMEHLRLLRLAGRDVNHALRRLGVQCRL